MKVVDANVLAYYFIDCQYTPLARRLFELDSEWMVPALWRHEFLSILLKIARQGTQSETELLTVWEYANVLVQGNEREIDWRLAFHLAIQYHVSSYDAQYLALVQTLGVSLITEDRKLRQAAPKLTLSMQACLDQP